MLILLPIFFLNVKGLQAQIASPRPVFPLTSLLLLLQSVILHIWLRVIRYLPSIGPRGIRQRLLDCLLSHLLLYLLLLIDCRSAIAVATKRLLLRQGVLFKGSHDLIGLSLHRKIISVLILRLDEFLNHGLIGILLLLRQLGLIQLTMSNAPLHIFEFIYYDCFSVFYFEDIFLLLFLQQDVLLNLV